MNMIDYRTKQEVDGDLNVLGTWHRAALRVLSVTGKRVLDIGCGSGSFLKAVQPTTAEVLGIDPNPHNIEVLTEHAIGGRVGYVEDFTAELKGRFDIATCFEVVEHLYAPWELFAGAHAALVTGGLFVVSTPNAFHVLRGLDFLFRQKHRDVLMDPSRCAAPEHIRLWSATMLIRALQKAHFGDVRCYGVVRLFNKTILLKRTILIRLCAQNLICVGKK